MKKLLLILMMVLLLAGTATGEVIVTDLPSGVQVVTEKLTLSADASAVDFTGYFEGGYLYQVEIFASADDAMTFTINSYLGTEFYTTTTTAATSGQVDQPWDFYFFPDGEVPNYTLSGLGSGTVTIEVTVVRR